MLALLGFICTFQTFAGRCPLHVSFFFTEGYPSLFGQGMQAGEKDRIGSEFLQSFVRP